MLTDRQLMILQVIIDDFIESAHPVGSRAISKKDEISFSAATIRNVMADLEEMGFIEKTHSSSGRVPSEKGYRYYVDHVIAPSIDKSNLNIMKDLIRDEFIDFEKLVQKSAEVLSDLTNYTSIILGPEIFETKVKQLQIVPLSDHTAVAILVTDSGHVEHRSFTIPGEISPSDLEKIVNILNERLKGVSLARLPDVITTEVVSLMRIYVRDFEKSFQYLSSAFFHDQPVKLYIGGKTNLLTQPEFNDINKVRSFYQMMENENQVVNLLKTPQHGIKVTIGNENKVDVIKDFSLITASYQLGSEQMGTIALIGPTRMEYRKVITLLNALSNEMTDALYLWYKNNG
ncbi:heat-inducible transcriptional repressor HrcA [Ornithinibacillus sp. BX22]|uniref:Heat-inducible transcription repressor HrcA n=2 Tax=Ornithinibacillus TaxID=484508 RepID=A0A923L974_9BACI|nr:MULTISPECIES: heat-inducible transcriptional repressor HrcA [Ornithinibacillus]MBC5638788.1 heat-inducible transcriptional repressor HrcA [Ornithinibacillus hominis]MBS3679530.1 heat-inducible transcriptional repressor HrcA [Ornithinibacillus massiliensis]